MKKLRCALTVIVMGAGFPAAVQGDVFPLNSGTGGAPSPLSGTTNPATGDIWRFGDTYHLAFVTSSTTNMSVREDIHFWNDVVNTVAAGSALPAIPNLTWKVIGSDLNTHARDNAPVTGPVFLVDATTKLADGFVYLWNGSIDARLDMDEHGNPGSGEIQVWSGSGNNGLSAGNRSFNGIDNFVRRGERTQVNGNWISRDDRTRSENKRLYALSQPLRIVGPGPDNDPPVPDPMTWARPPNGNTTNSILMTATLAHDLQSPSVQYLFTNTVTGEFRDWGAGRTWINTVAGNSINTYMVKARDAVSNETAWSAAHSATPLLKGPNGLAAPTGIHPTNGSPWQTGDIYHLAFVSSTTTNMTNRLDIHSWNDTINTIAGRSLLPGVSGLTWKVIGSDIDTHARDNALVTAPVYLTDATTKIADGFVWMWNGSIDARLDRDEHGHPGSGDVGVWSGSGNTGFSAGNRSFNGIDNFVRRGERNQVNGNWISRDDRTRTENRHLYGLSQPIRISDGGPDTTPPSPDPMTWAEAPNGLTTNSILMKATLAWDLDSPPVEYFITNTITGDFRDWATSRTWTQIVAGNSLNIYQVKARDAEGNETAWSAPHTATPLLKGPNGVAAPTGIHPTNGIPWQAGDVYHLAFVSSITTNMSARENIHFWNDTVQTLAESSSLPGISNLTWKVIGSDLQTHARDNAVVSAPVYLVDATTRIADGFDDIWNGSIDNRLDRDEHGNLGSGEVGVWSGSGNTGLSAGNRSFNGLDNFVRRGERTQVNGNWISRDDRNRSENRRIYALSQPIRIVGGAIDNTPPSPDPMTFDIPPAGLSTTSIHMRATLAYDLDSPDIEYLFTNTVSGETSGWQTRPDWINTVPPGWANTYRVKARDGAGNETAWSAPFTAKPLLLGPNGVLAPAGINPVTGKRWQDGDTYHLAFVTSTTDDLVPAEDIVAWNAYVNTVADTSSLSGVPDTDWKIIGSTTNVHARDNALVSAPVYLLDGTTKLADGFADMWDARLDAPLNRDENGAPGTGSTDAWTGSTTLGLSWGNFALNGTDSRAGRGHRTVFNNQWIQRDTQNRTQLRHFYALSEPLTIAYMAVNVINNEAENIGPGTADLVGTVYAPLGQTLDLTVYWSTNNNAGSAAWLADPAASSLSLGAFTNVVGRSVTGSVAGLISDVVYY
ncbi:MAG: hypothetical protein AAF492_02450 [Verrucomicrobiota bacterium]